MSHLILNLTNVEILLKQGFTYIIIFFLKNLKRKGFIDSYKKGITFFVPIVNFEEYRNKTIKKFIDFWFDGDKDKLVSEVKNIYKSNL